jgi:uncharacterized membrane protein
MWPNAGDRVIAVIGALTSAFCAFIGVWAVSFGEYGMNIVAAVASIISILLLVSSLYLWKDA